MDTDPSSHPMSAFERPRPMLVGLFLLLVPCSFAAGSAVTDGSARGVERELLSDRGDAIGSVAAGGFARGVERELLSLLLDRGDAAAAVVATACVRGDSSGSPKGACPATRRGPAPKIKV